MRAPSIILATKDELNTILQRLRLVKHGYSYWYEPVRPFGKPNRWKATWLVFTGKADAITWVDHK